MAPEAAVSIFDAHLFFAWTTEFQRPKVDVPNSVVDLLQTNIFAGAVNADVDPGTVPADATVVAHIASFKMCGVLKRRQLGGKGTRRGLIETGRGFQGQRLVWPLVIELQAKAIEGTLLRAAVSCGRAGGFSF